MRGDLGTGEAAIFSEPRRGKGLGGDAAAASAAGVFEAGGARRDCRPSASITSTHLLPPAPYRGESLVAARFETQPGLSAPLPRRPPPDYSAAVNQYSHEAARHRRLLLSRCLPFAHLPESPAHTLRRLRGFSRGAFTRRVTQPRAFFGSFLRLEAMKAIFHCLMWRNRLENVVLRD